MPALDIHFDDTIQPRIDALLAGLGTPLRKQFMETVGLPVEKLTRHYLDEEAASRHDTANALGATPSGFFAQAAEKVNLRVDDKAATVSIDQAGMGRAAHDVDIGPGPKLLTIPLIAAAYNQAARKVTGLFPIQLIGGALMLAQEAPDGGLVFWYALVPSVHQVQDRTMLPSDEAIGQAAKEGALHFLNDLFEEVSK